jgi:hypothetical protein
MIYILGGPCRTGKGPRALARDPNAITYVSPRPVGVSPVSRGQAPLRAPGHERLV